jgi:hypothetical protein
VGFGNSRGLVFLDESAEKVAAMASERGFRTRVDEPHGFSPSADSGCGRRASARSVLPARDHCGVNALRGWRRHVLLRAKDLAARAGVSDRSVTPRTVDVDVRPLISDSLVFLMLGRDAADGQMRLTPLFRRFDTTWSERASQSLFATFHCRRVGGLGVAEAPTGDCRRSRRRGRLPGGGGSDRDREPSARSNQRSDEVHIAASNLTKCR